MTNSKRSVFVYLALGFAMLVWGLSFLVTKDVVSHVPLFTLLFLRFSIAAILLGAIGGVKRTLAVPWRDLALLASLALLSPIGYFIFETFGVANTQPSHVSVIIAAIPTVVFLITLAKRQERATWRKGIGLVVTYIGIVLLVASGLHEAGARVLGDILVFGAVMCAAARTVLIKDVLRRITPLQLTFYQFLFSLVIFGPLAATDSWSWVATITAVQASEILFLGVLCSAGAFVALHYALTHLSATQVAATVSFIPVITLLAEVLIMGARLSPLKGLGVVTAVAGVLLVQINRKKHQETMLAEG
ncbi:MAG: DMT family transporter [Candidatus Bipolaricaulota bacterium]|nr:DMT family transporter [Candidatus Bipolaricaulota bacterium]